MDKINALKDRKSHLYSISSAVRENINKLTDEKSFVELDAFAFSHNAFYDTDIYGEGVVTGFSLIDNKPCYVVAINFEILNGGLGQGGCEKIIKCLDKAGVSGAPVVYLLSSNGVLAGEGVTALEGIARVLAKVNELTDRVPQFAVCSGKLLGSPSLIAAACDYKYFINDACVCYDSPYVVCAKSKVSLDEAKAGGSACANGLCDFVVEDFEQVRESITKILNILPNYSQAVIDEDDLNRTAPNLNQKACAKCLLEAVYDKNSFVTLNKGYAKEVVTSIGRVGGHAVATIIFDGEDGVELTNENVDKVTSFIYYATDNNLPIITFVNTLGIKADLQTAASPIMKNVTSLIYALSYGNQVPRINVVYGKAIGLGYTLFATKAHGVDYSIAFANALISPVSDSVGAEMHFAEVGGNKEDLKNKFREEDMDAMNTAKKACLDNVIEPAHVRQHVIAALQMLTGC